VTRLRANVARCRFDPALHVIGVVKTTFARKFRVIGISVASLLMAMNASAEVIYDVNSNADLIDNDLLVATCNTAANTCTLRAAVMQANRIGGDVTINVPAGTYFLGKPTADAEGSGDLNLNAPSVSNAVITITGKGPALTIIDGSGTDRVLSVAAGRTAVLGSLTIQHGDFHGEGGGINNEGILTLTNVVVRGNHSTEYCGGGIHNVGQLGVYSSTIGSNVSDTGIGGGVCSNGAAGPVGLTIVKSTIDHNFARSGGGIYNTNGAVVVMINSTISGNYANTDGGGIYSYGTINIYNSTIAFNQADADGDLVGKGGGIYSDASGGTFNLRNSVVAGNYHGPTLQVPDDCNGAFGSYGVNKFWVIDGCSITQFLPGNVWTGMESLAELGPLHDNGGPTRTHALVPPSSLVDGGEPTQGCVDSNNHELTIDQRGSSRVMTGFGCDIGAFEYDEFIFQNGFDRSF
jgi:hypothetical protein